MVVLVQGHAHRIKFVVDWGRRRGLEKTNLSERRKQEIFKWLGCFNINLFQVQSFFVLPWKFTFCFTACTENSVVHQGSFSLHSHLRKVESTVDMFKLALSMLSQSGSRGGIKKNRENSLVFRELWNHDGAISCLESSTRIQRGLWESTGSFCPDYRRAESKLSRSRHNCYLRWNDKIYTYLSRQPPKPLSHRQISTGTKRAPAGPHVWKQHFPFPPFRSRACHQRTYTSDNLWVRRILNFTWIYFFNPRGFILRHLCAHLLHQLGKPWASKRRRDPDARKHVTRRKPLEVRPRLFSWKSNIELRQSRWITHHERI